MDKSVIRKMMKEKRLLIEHKTLSFYNQCIYQKVMNHSLCQKAKMIGCYVSLPKEVDTLKLIQKLLPSHRICVPKVEGTIMHFYEINSLDDLKEGHFHVLEPVTTKKVNPWDIDLMIVPMLAYDQSLYRVGYGKGFYDKYFASGFKGYKLGLAYSFQYVEAIHYDHYDYKLDEVLTEI